MSLRTPTPVQLGWMDGWMWMEAKDLRASPNDTVSQAPCLELGEEVEVGGRMGS